MRFAAVLILALVAPLVAASAQERRAEEAFYRAFYLETALRDFEAAEKAYAEAATAADPAKPDLQVKAHLGRARALQALGRAEEAERAYQRALELDPSNEEAKAALARRAGPTGDDEEVAQAIERLIVELHSGNRDQAMSNLFLIGARAIPRLERALHEKHVGLVDGAARTLAVMNSTESWAALGRALSHRELPFPEPIVRQMTSDRANLPSTEAWRALLSRPEAEYRTDGLRRLRVWQGSIPQGDLIALLEGAMHDSSVEVRIAALDKEWAPELRRELLAAIRGALRAATPTERLAAISAASSLDKDLLPELTGALEDSNPEVRAQALQRISEGFRVRSGNQTYLWGDVPRDLAASMLEDPDQGVVASAAGLLYENRTSWAEHTRKLVERALARAVRGEITDSRAVSAILKLANPPPDEALQHDALLNLYALAGSASNRLNEEDKRNLQFAIARRIWERVSPRQKADLLARGLKVIEDVDSRARWLQQGVDSKTAAREAYLEAARSDHPSIRAQAYRGLVQDFSPEEPAPAGTAVLPHLAEDLASSDKRLREPSLEVALRIPHPSLAQALRERHAAAKGDVRVRSLRALVRSIGKEALPEVREDLASDDRSVRTEALRQVVALLGEEAADDLARVAVRLSDAVPFYQVINISQWPRDLLARYVNALPDTLLSKRLLEVTRSSLPREAVEKLAIRALRSADPETLQAAAHAAGMAPAESAWPRLVELLDSHHELVRSAARDALQSIRSYREIKATFGPEAEKGRAQAIEQAKRLLGSPDPVQRKGGVLALAALGDAGTVSVLLGALEDPDASVREAALHALERLGAAARK